jgi:periplasmic protein TonB
MHEHDMETPVRRRIETPYELGGCVVKPKRSASLFQGWGPKLFAAAIAVAGFGLTTSHALAADQLPACSVPDRPAAVVTSAIPDYPEIARGQGAAGSALVQVEIAPSGRPANAAIARSSGNEYLDREALRVVLASRFTPAMSGCEPLAGQYLYEVEFRNDR